MVQSWLRYFIEKFVTYIMLSDLDGNQNGIEKWRISALRIMIITGFISYSGIALHSSISAAEINLYYIIPLTLAFYIGAALQLWFSSKYYIACAYSMLVTIVAASVSINLVAQSPLLALFGPVFIFSLPLGAFILLGPRVGFICMAINILPFAALLTGFQFSQYFPPHPPFEYANLYVMSLIFIFFNICAPLGIARSSLAARRLNKELVDKNQSLQTQNDFYRALFVETNVAKFVIDQNDVIIEINLAAKKVAALRSTTTSQQGVYI
ncbi:hypothetical protein RS130_14965 [Paraglaciecola aquimarina]|uniref:Uncharacterized protein n=1 Tax=Paraglaciecola aquimarina TaxID=1235557 RepID=A0ABU3SYE0_9ALTE|nr:hypothetical protein [Paraglaciecola aquimarina]MDU0355027.1 hypothetical protein [Paraglaciecola aquimarina]